MADNVHVYQQPPAQPSGSGGGRGWLVAVVGIVLVLGVLWFAFMRGGGSVVPEQIDIDVNLPEAPAPSQPQQPTQPQPAPQPPGGGAGSAGTGG